MLLPIKSFQQKFHLKSVEMQNAFIMILCEIIDEVRHKIKKINGLPVKENLNMECNSSKATCQITINRLMELKVLDGQHF